MSVFDNLQIPKVIYEAESQYNGSIRVFQVGSVRKIKVGNTDQSISPNSQACRRLVWGKVDDVLKEETPELKSILILGLGGGTVVHLISKDFPQAQMVSVEIDPVMVDVANKYFDLTTIPNHRVIVDDAMRVVVEPESFDIVPGTFEALLVDIYVGDKFPDLGKSGNFISAIKRLVMPGGLIIFNRIYVEEHQDDVNIFVDNVSNFLRNVKCLIVAGYTNSDNMLIYGRV